MNDVVGFCVLWPASFVDSSYKMELDDNCRFSFEVKHLLFGNKFVEMPTDVFLFNSQTDVIQ